MRDGKRLKHSEEGYWSETIPEEDRSNLLSTVVNAANTMICLSEKRGEGETPLIYVNRYFCEFTGYEPEEILDRDCRFLQFRDGQRIEQDNLDSRAELRESIRERRFVRMTLRNFKKDGTEFRNELYLSPLEEPDGSVRFFVGVQNDVTERDLLIDRLQESESSLNATFAASPVALAVVEREGDGPVRHLRVNPAAARLLLRDADRSAADQCVGRSLEDLNVPAPLSNWLNDAFETIASGEVGEEPLRCRLDQMVHGERRHLAVSATAVGAGPEGARRFCYTAEDLTEFDALEADRTLMRAAVQQTDVPTLIVDNELDPPGPKIVYANPAAIELVGFPAEELNGALLTTLDGPRTDRDFPARMRQALKQDGRFHGESLVYDADGTPLSVEWDVSAVRDSEGTPTHYAVTLRDLRGRRELESQVLSAQTREQARIARDLHDGVAQQLAGLNMLCGTLKAQAAAGEDVTEAVDGIVEVVRSAARDLRGVAHGLMPLDPDRGGLAEGLKRLAAISSEITLARCTFEAPDGPVPVGDPDVAHHLYRIAQEALSNAVRHGRAKHVRLILANDGPDCALLSIVDDGIGFEGSNPNADPEGGIGLTAMRFRAQAIHGRLRFELEESGGTRIVCAFPHAGDRDA
ncbi:PAS domain-containing sensor histidine kinase [Alienimonas californiensis]|uniref:PAS domain-containing sensor histidine kinase n=1 Tax=Alienimonas californiensis TaxID=2527989 RepID=UPI0013FCF54B|nr:PAS domain S-box protein [Alienimonas californiensis]